MKIVAIILIVLSGVGIYFALTTSYLKQTRSYRIKEEYSPFPIIPEDIYESNKLINPLLGEINDSEFFKIFLVNIIRPWPFWATSEKCKMNFCPIEEEETLGNRTHVKIFQIDKKLTAEDTEFTSHIPLEQYRQSNNTDDEWMIDEHLDEDAFFVDLLNNPERFSGYNGSDIWHELYISNLENLKFDTKGPHEDFLYRMISGIQVNVNSHIAHHYLYDMEVNEAQLSDFKPNYDIFYNRIGSHPDRIKNLFFAYTYLLHSLSKIGPLLSHFTYDTTSQNANELLQSQLKWVVHYIHSIEGIDEQTNFNITEVMTKIKPTFRNITGLLDCIGWNIWKLNAKVQLTGATALFKILFEKDKASHLTENELSGYLNLIHRLSNSIKWYHEWTEYEDQHSFWKTVLMAVIISLLGLIILVSIAILLIKKEKNEEEKILISNTSQPKSHV